MVPLGRGDGVASANVGDGVTGSGESTGDETGAAGAVASVGGVTGAGPEDEHAETAMLHTSTATATRRLRVRISRSSASPASGTVRLMADTVAARLGAALGARAARGQATRPAQIRF